MADNLNGQPERRLDRHPPRQRDREAGLPLAVWPVGQASVAEQRADRYLATTVDTAELMPPVLAARIVATYSRPGQTVCDVVCGTGTVLVEAVHAGRSIMGMDLDPARVHTAALNVAVARLTGSTDTPVAGTGGREVVCADARSAPDALSGRAAADLMVTHLPQPGTPTPRRRDDPDLAALTGDAYWDAVTELAAAARRLTAPGAHLVIVVRGYQRGGRHVDSAAAAVAAARRAGWIYLQHVIAVRAPLRADRIHGSAARQRPFPRRRAPVHQVVHDDVLAFTAPDTPEGTGPDAGTDTGAAQASRGSVEEPAGGEVSGDA